MASSNLPALMQTGGPKKKMPAKPAPKGGGMGGMKGKCPKCGKAPCMCKKK